MEALHARISARRSDAGLVIWFVGDMGHAASIACVSETAKAGYLANMHAKGRIILSDSGMAGLTASYVRTIGIDPFVGYPRITEAEMAQTLADHITTIGSVNHDRG